MTAELFALPFPGRCLSPSPEPKRPRFEKGDWVVWSQDHEEGLVTAVTPDAVCVFWEESQLCRYPIHSLAATERIVPIEHGEEVVE